MKNIIGTGNLDDLFLTYIYAKSQYPEFMYCHFNLHNEDWHSKFKEFLQEQNQKFQIYEFDFETMKGYFPDFELIDFNKEYPITISDITLPNKKGALAKENFNVQYTLVQIEHQNKKIEDIPSLRKAYKELKFIGDEVNSKLKSYYNYSIYDKLYLIKHCSVFVGFESLYSYYAGLLGIPQFIISESPQKYPKQWLPQIQFFKTETDLINHLKIN